MLFQRYFHIRAILVLAKEKDGVCVHIFEMSFPYNDELRVLLQRFFSAVSLRAAILMAGSFSEIYIHHGVFNRGTNLVSV